MDSKFTELQQVNPITENLEHRISQSFKGDTFFLEIYYLGGKFTINKVFPNTYIGREQLDKAIKQFNTEEKVKEYFKL